MMGLELFPCGGQALCHALVRPRTLTFRPCPMVGCYAPRSAMSAPRPAWHVRSRSEQATRRHSPALNLWPSGAGPAGHGHGPRRSRCATRGSHYGAGIVRGGVHLETSGMMTAWGVPTRTTIASSTLHCAQSVPRFSQGAGHSACRQRRRDLIQQLIDLEGFQDDPDVQLV